MQREEVKAVTGETRISSSYEPRPATAKPGGDYTQTPKRIRLRAPPVIYVEFESRVWRKNLRDLAQPFGHRSRRQQRIIAFAQIVVIDIEIE